MAKLKSLNLKLKFTSTYNTHPVVIKYKNTTVQDEIDLINSAIQSEFGTYKGTHSDVKRAFEVNHDNNPVFEKEFLGICK